jgi:hypothetical protein
MMSGVRTLPKAQNFLADDLDAGLRESSIGNKARLLACRITYQRTQRIEQVVEWDGNKARVR